MRFIFGRAFVFGWDARKATLNQAKHGVAFSAIEEFDFDSCVDVEDTRKDYGEVRYVAIGFIAERLFVTVFTFRDLEKEIATVWVISLRKANKREIDKYVRETE